MDLTSFNLDQDGNASLTDSHFLAKTTRELGRDRRRIKTLDDDETYNLLILGCKHNSVECLRLLLEGNERMPALINKRGVHGQTPLHIAAAALAANCVELLLNAKARTDHRLKIHWCLDDDSSILELLTLLETKDLRAIKLLADRTRDVSLVAYSCAMKGQIIGLAALLLAVNDRVLAPLIVRQGGLRRPTTVYNSVLDKAIFLADMRNADDNEDSARREDLLFVIQLLHHFGADYKREFINKSGLLPLHAASKFGDVVVMKLLLKAETDVNETDDNGNSALHWCLTMTNPPSKQCRIINLLLNNGADACNSNHRGQTPVHVAAAKGNAEALKLLLSHAPESVNKNCKSSETPLFHAVKCNSITCVRLLLEFGADTQAQNLRKQRPVDVATSQDMRFILNQVNQRFMKNPVLDDASRHAKYGGSKRLLQLRKPSSSSAWNRKLSVNQQSEATSSSASNSVQGHVSYQPGRRPSFVAKYNFRPQNYDCKVFIGGLPPTVDSNDLADFLTAEFGPVDEVAVIGTGQGKDLHSRGFAFATFLDEEDCKRAKTVHFVELFGKTIEIKKAIKKAQMLELKRSGQLDIDAIHQKSVVYKKSEAQLVPENRLPSWVFIFRRWLPGFLKDAVKRLDHEEYPLSSLKNDFRVACKLELDHASLGYLKLSDFINSLPGLCEMRTVGHGAAATHAVLVPSPVTPRHVELLAPVAQSSTSDAVHQDSPSSQVIQRSCDTKDDTSHDDSSVGSNLCAEDWALIAEGLECIDLEESRGDSEQEEGTDCSVVTAETSTVGELKEVGALQEAPLPASSRSEANFSLFFWQYDDSIWRTRRQDQPGPSTSSPDVPRWA